jgi:murein DD-endopeptidase MepM/ murein hydrolase activator NlpD
VPRSRPRTPRARAATTLVAATLVCAGLVAPLAVADPPGSGTGGDLQQRKSRVEHRITGVHSDLDESSAQLRDATSALTSARTRLGAAQAQLAATRGQLAAARVLDQRMAAELRAARLRLRRAERDLDAGRADIAEEQHVLGRIVAEQQTGEPSLMGLSMVLTSQDPTELTGQLNSVQNVMDKESVVLDRLEATRALLSVQEQEVRTAQGRVADRRAAAAANLARKRGLETQAEAAEASVHSLVDARTKARQAAAEARSADLAQLANLQTERDRIAAVLKRRADRARARAAAAAAAAGNADGGALGDGGAVASNGFLNYPVNGPVTSPFGWRIHPIYGYRSLHDGVDFGVACGTPIRATAAGTVLERYFQTAWGNRVIVDHGFHHGVGLATISNHMNAPALVAPGQHVERGQILGYVGTTGWSTGCHLHFTVMQNGVAVNPMSWF